MRDWMRAVVGSCFGLLITGCLTEQQGADGGALEEADEAEATQALGLPTAASAPSVVAAFGMARLDVFFTNANARLVRRTWTPSTGWSGDISMPFSHAIEGPPSCVTRRPGVIDCFVRNVDGQVRGINLDGGLWSEWMIVPGAVSDSPPSAAVTAYDQVDLFYALALNLRHHRWTQQSAWVARPSHEHPWPIGAPSCGAKGDSAPHTADTWSCAFLANGLVYSLHGDETDHVIATTYEADLGVAPSAHARGDLAYIQLFHRSPEGWVTHRYDAGPYVETFPGWDLVDMPRCAPWGTGQMLCFSRDSSDHLVYSFHTYAGEQGGTWTEWERQ